MSPFETKFWLRSECPLCKGRPDGYCSICSGKGSLPNKFSGFKIVWLSQDSIRYLVPENFRTLTDADDYANRCMGEVSWYIVNPAGKLVSKCKSNKQYA